MDFLLKYYFDILFLAMRKSRSRTPTNISPRTIAKASLCLYRLLDIAWRLSARTVSTNFLNIIFQTTFCRNFNHRNLRGKYANRQIIKTLLCLGSVSSLSKRNNWITLFFLSTASDVLELSIRGSASFKEISEDSCLENPVERRRPP